MTYSSMEHITLTTGHYRLSPRHEVGDDVVALLSPIVAKGAGEIADTGWSVKMVHGVGVGSCGFELHYRGIWAVSCYMAWTASDDIPMWGVASERHGVQRVKRPRSLPWLAAAIMPTSIIFLPTAMLEVGDLERCVAWTILDLSMAGVCP